MQDGFVQETWVYGRTRWKRRGKETNAVDGKRAHEDNRFKEMLAYGKFASISFSNWVSSAFGMS